MHLDEQGHPIALSADGDTPRARATGRLSWSSPTTAGVEFSAADGALVVGLSGALWSSSANRIAPLLASLITVLSPHELHIDLADVEFLDARAVSMLVGAGHAARELGASATVVNPSEAARRVLALCGIDASLGTSPAR